MLDLGVEFRAGQAHRQPEGAARRSRGTRCSSAAARRAVATSTCPGRSEAAANIHIGIDWLASVSFGHITRIGKRVVVLGGGNTAMDCCRSSRRLGGEDVQVVVRSGFDEMKASPWEKEDAMHEGIPIHNFLVPKEFTHDAGKLTGVTFEKVAPRIDANGRRELVPTGEPAVHIPCDDVLVAIGQENAFPVDRARPRHRVRPARACRWSTRRRWRRRAPASSSAATRRSARRTSSGRSRTATRRRSRSTCSAAARTSRSRPPPHTSLISQKMGIHEWSYDNAISRRPPLPRAAQGHQDRAEEHPRRGRAGLRPEARARRDAALPQLRRADGVQRQAVHRMRRLRRHLPDGLHHLHRATATRPTCARGCARRRRTSTQDLYVSGALKTGRVMAKDEDVCLHCGLCAERCPTGAWDMQKFLFEPAQAHDRCRTRHVSAPVPAAPEIAGVAAE